MGSSAISRRTLLAAASGLPAAGWAADKPARPAKTLQFPKNFLWGTATAAYQTEGSPSADGRGPSIWDSFSHINGNIADGSTGDVACDSYRRWQEEVALMQRLNLSASRFSLSWTRIQPQGTGPANQKGIDHYRRLAEAMHASRIVPFATLFHWDLPQALQDRGGWKNRDTAKRFADYADIVGRQLGGSIGHFILLNEANSHAFAGHLLGNNAPGLRGEANLCDAIHGQNMATGLGFAALKAAAPQARVGTTILIQPVLPQAAADHDAHQRNMQAAEGLDHLWNRAFLDPVLRGQYTPDLQAMLGARVVAGDLAQCHAKLDFLGVNYYAPFYVSYDAAMPHGIHLHEPPAGGEHAGTSSMFPPGMGMVLDRVRLEYGNMPVFITENGVMVKENPAAMGNLQDDFRIHYLRRHLQEVHAAIGRGCDVRGYFHWTLIDNWEWDSGFGGKMGFYAMRPGTLERVAKTSAAWYAGLARTGTLRL